MRDHPLHRIVDHVSVDGLVGDPNKSRKNKNTIVVVFRLTTCLTLFFFACFFFIASMKRSLQLLVCVGPRHSKQTVGCLSSSMPSIDIDFGHSMAIQFKMSPSLVVVPIRMDSHFAFRFVRSF
ncbi:hypothetical protein OUZ56_028653 [Daphnia magna]|uniref:Transmembrane protein n=1 Tax=Daphnia magna TaxID=35525 RepID=A0ABR0B4L3_9CRUS|nr:hypothetical protein OUZ56_028653 [Daphnia magna]